MPLFIPITKVDVAQRLVHGTLSEEVADKAGEILDYESAKPAFMEWSQQFHDASGGKSLGNVRAMHGNIAAGKLTDIFFDDINRRIEGVAKVVDDDAWNKVMEGVYTGFSIGGGYAKRWPDPYAPGLMRYTPTLSEVSLVDNPAVPTATFSVIKLDGSTELRRFTHIVEKAALSNEESLRNGLIWLAAQDIGDALQEHISALLDYFQDNDSATEKNYLPAGLRKMQQTVQALTKRIAVLEAMPMPAKGTLKSVVKSDDYAGNKQMLDLSDLSAGQRAQELVKIALAHPNAI